MECRTVRIFNAEFDQLDYLFDYNADQHAYVFCNKFCSWRSLRDGSAALYLRNRITKCPQPPLEHG